MKEIEKHNRIRNFSIIAHIDHGKSTLADRLLEFTDTVSSHDLIPQFLDKMDLEREYHLSLISTAPNVVYLVTTQKGETLKVESPHQLPLSHESIMIAEPFILASIHVPSKHLGEVLRLCEEKRGGQKDLSYRSTSRF